MNSNLNKIILFVMFFLSTASAAETIDKANFDTEVQYQLEHEYKVRRIKREIELVELKNRLQSIKEVNAPNEELPRYFVNNNVEKSEILELISYSKFNDNYLFKINVNEVSYEAKDNDILEGWRVFVEGNKLYGMKPNHERKIIGVLN
ncbi:hypothetical protein [Vibrio splendidus]|uniref:hypothetical protein n=1 Tax=Vibrio splendidus TaxID=29497 RepID=UPI0021B20D17|nr:hypothetical protein [Vibrio splendidus]UWZ98594.1 hypothetical protein IM698_04355 [Vibrio splendidus]